jgi:fructoselysine-6-P-deglycase FrlB-like protein
VTNEVRPARSDGLAHWATFREAMAQPAIWRSWADELPQHAESISAWIRQRSPGEVWFCGAGTSAYIGDTLCAYLNTVSGRQTRYRAIPTTDFVSCPRDFLHAPERLLVVSFGRSGGSPETIGTLDLLDTHLPGADRLHITCNPEGALARRVPPGPGQQRVLVMPIETNDSGFAMTSSYSTMLLSALACLDETPPLPPRSALQRLAAAADDVIAASERLWVETPSCPSRAVFLGSGTLMGSARESALKVLELAAGRIPTAWDSTLGFRHGPKAVVDRDTRVHVLVSNDLHTMRYDLDAADEIRRQFGHPSIIVQSSDPSRADLLIPLVGNDAWTSVLHVLVAQIQAIRWSDALAMNVDNPFGAGTLTRVVEGVTLYPLDLGL